MSYEVLARKWRPTRFADVVGQETAVQALQNALAAGRLHHAYLFTGTRGVGKTTLARIMARALNCEQGISAEPCGTCTSCCEIGEGRFPDLVEVDAASRTKVEDTRELLENIQYAPVRGRFRVYLIDEVHMLSGHSFNALLKTLEEPPGHVKFLFATTDPRKLPATVLSRCLQFHLRRIPLTEIISQLQSILREEKIPAQEGALRALARAADGSLRDAISLCDQAIAHGGGKLEEEQVDAMLGTVDRGRVFALLDALVEQDGTRLLREVQEMSALCPDYEGVLAELLSTVHSIAVLQAVPDAAAEEEQAEQLQGLAGRLTPEELQLFYQAGVIGRRDFPLAPDPRSALEMTLLRMLAFRPDTGGGRGAHQAAGGHGAGAQDSTVSETTGAAKSTADAAPDGTAAAGQATADRGGAKVASETTGAAKSTADAAPDSTSAAGQATAGRGGAKVASGAAGAAKKQAGGEEHSGAAAENGMQSPAATALHSASEVSAPAAKSLRAVPDNGGAESMAAPLFHPEEWNTLVENLALTGFAVQVARSCAVDDWQGNQVSFVLDERHSGLFQRDEAGCIAEFERGLQDCFGQAVRVSIRIGQPQAETPRDERERNAAQRRAAAEQQLRNDPNVQLLQERFGARLDPASITLPKDATGG